jgi:membrane protein
MIDRWQRLLAAADRWIGRRRLTRVTRLALVGFGDHQGPQVAGSMAYFAMLALFQLVVLGVVVFSLLIGEGDARRVVIDRLQTALPLQAGTIDQVVDSIIATRGGITVISVAILAWGGLGFFDALSVGVGRAFAAPSRRPFWQEKLIVLLLMVSAGLLAIVALLIGLASGIAAGFAERLPGGATNGQLTIDLIGLILPILLVLAALLVVYRLVPNRRVRMRQAWPGALLATVLWTALRVSFTWYATSVARYESFFGPISTAITLLVFLYFSSAVVLLGAEVSRAVLLDDEALAQAAPEPVDSAV